MMINQHLLASAFLACALLSSSSSFAQGATRGPGGSRIQVLYDTASIQTVRGEVIAVNTFPGTRGIGVGIHITLKSDSGSISVHLGPRWYLDRQKVKIVKGDMITVVGSRIIIEANPVVVAGEVEKGGDTLRLRDRQGFPLWSRRQRQGSESAGQDLFGLLVFTSSRRS